MGQVLIVPVQQTFNVRIQGKSQILIVVGNDVRYEFLADALVVAVLFRIAYNNINRQKDFILGFLLSQNYLIGKKQQAFVLFVLHAESSFQQKHPSGRRTGGCILFQNKI